MSGRPAVCRCSAWPALALALVRAAAAGPATPVGGVGSADRYAVVLAYHGASLAFARPSGSCAADPSSLDVLSGIVDRLGGPPDDGTVVYEGTLRRSTNQTMCGSEPHVTRRVPSREAQLCRARLSGAADAHVRVKVRSTGLGLQGAWIVLTPTDAMAEVTGSCSPGEMREMRRSYWERITIEIPLPHGHLSPGRFTADEETGRWQMTVSPPSEEPSR